MDYIYKSTNGVANKQPLTVGVVWLWEEIGFLRTCKQIHREGSEILYRDGGREGSPTGEGFSSLGELQYR
ncbi:hypothetical protein LTS03_010326 [Exophiala xenobiotica]|nr:hypothetical protein LTS03_010326 [Exophiala xenobiotica]